MNGRGRLLLLIAGICLVLVVGCSRPPDAHPGHPAILEGVNAITMLRSAHDPGPSGMAIRQVADDIRVVVDYFGGPTCVSDTWRQQPGVVTAQYGPDAVTIWIEPGTRGCGDVELGGFAAAVEIELQEPIGDRALSVAPRGDAYYESNR